MKKIKYLYLLIFLAAVVFTGCEKKNLETEGLSTVTTYAIITIDGDATIFVPKGTTYTDAGATASGGEDVIVTNPVNTASCGFYTVNYLAYNVDGFPAQNSRTVIVYEEDAIIAGVYDGIRISKNAGGIVLIYPNGAGAYTCSDLVCGYYEFGTNNYGNDFAAEATLNLSGNTITSPGGAMGFGPISISDGLLNGNTITWTTSLDAHAFAFTCQLVKKVI